jgi:hypothetical protein
LTVFVEGILLGLLVLPLCVWAVISPRTLRRMLPHNPDAPEPGTTAYVAIRLVALIPIAALIATAVLVYGTGKPEKRLTAAVVTLQEVASVPVTGYRQGASDREIAVVVQTGRRPCHVEAGVAGASIAEVEIRAMLVSPASPLSTPCATGADTTTVWVVLDQPLAERTVVTRAPRPGTASGVPWGEPLRIVPRIG